MLALAQFETTSVLKQVVGLRPYRRGSFRLELEARDSGQLMVHNYGHGGSGITLCWGVAEAATELLLPHLSKPQAIAVLGAGVIGLCTAHRLTELGHSVTIYSEKFSPETTSDVAGGLWAPTHIDKSHLDPDLYRRILSVSWKAFEQREGPEYGVQRVDLYESENSDHPLDPMPEWLTGPCELLQRLPYSPSAKPGRLWKTWLIETPVFLRKLRAELSQRGVVFVQRRFTDSLEIEALKERIVVNCLGLGAKLVVWDPHLIPIRGELLHFKPLPTSFILDHDHGYVISRPDALILGGSYLEGVDDLTVCPATRNRILEAIRSYLSA